MNASTQTARRGRRTWHVWIAGEPGDPTSNQVLEGLVRRMRGAIDPLNDVEFYRRHSATRPGYRTGKAWSQALDRIRKVAKERKKEITALFHHLSLDLLEQAFFELKDNAAPGLDGVTWSDYEADLERNLEDLYSRLHRGAYRAMPSRLIPRRDARTVAGLCVVVSSGEDPSDRVRPFRFEAARSTPGR